MGFIRGFGLPSFEEQLQICSRVLAIREKSLDSEGILRAHIHLARIFVKLKKYDEAERSYRNSLDVELPPVYKVKAYHELGLLKWDQGHFDEALQILKSEIEICEFYSDDFQRTWRLLSDLVSKYESRRDFLNAKILYIKMLGFAHVNALEPHVNIGDVMYGLGNSLWELGEIESAGDMLRQELAYQADGKNEAKYRRSKHNYSRFLFLNGGCKEAETLMSSLL